MNQKIFIQIASYRDKQLLPTIVDCIKQADKPENLIFTIAWQHCITDKWDTLDPYKNDKRFQIIDIDYKDSKGVCWARSKIQEKYNGERYTLMIDSHHRFVPGWDSILKDMYSQLERSTSKPLITTYLPSLKLDLPRENWPKEPTIMTSNGTDRGIPVFIPKPAPHTEYPITGYCFSGHFAFTQGAFTQEVPHDPRLYFIGEEYTISVRAFTWGYDIFYPNKMIAWHQYTRSDRNTHWEDHEKWYFHDHESRRLIKNQFNKNNKNKIPLYISKYGLGQIRTMAEYEKLSKIRPNF